TLTTFGFGSTLSSARAIQGGDADMATRKAINHARISKPSLSILSRRNDLAAGVGGQGAVDVCTDRFRHEPDAAVTEHEVATAWVQAAEAGDHVGTPEVVPGVVVAPERRRDQPLVHRLVARVGGEPVLGSNPEDGAIPRLARVADARRAPRLLNDGPLARPRAGRRPRPGP